MVYTKPKTVHIKGGRDTKGRSSNAGRGGQQQQVEVLEDRRAAREQEAERAEQEAARKREEEREALLEEEEAERKALRHGLRTELKLERAKVSRCLSCYLVSA